MLFSVLSENSSEQHRLLATAAALKLTSRKLTLERRKSKTSSPTDDDVTVSLLADLQELQSSESERVLHSMTSQSAEDLLQTQLRLLFELRYRNVQNTADTLLCGEVDGGSGEQQVVDALEAKYDALRAQLLTEALMTQVGEAEWRRLSEQERQRRLTEKLLQERKLRQEGRFEDAAALLG